MDIINKYNIDLNNEIIKRAFTHSSYVNETKKGEDYERLEFLGDKILDFIVSEYLYVNDDYDEGKMTKLRSSYVCEKALACYSNTLGLPEYLRLGKGEELTGGRSKESIVADIFESFLAAVYLTKDFDTVKAIVYDVVLGKGTASSKKEAEQEAAKDALSKLMK